MSVLRSVVLAGLLTIVGIVPATAQEPVRAGYQHVIGPTPPRQYYRTFHELFSITRAGNGFLAASWMSANSDEEIVRLRALDDDGAGGARRELPGVRAGGPAARR